MSTRFDRPLEAILFDIDGTLLRGSGLHLRLLAEALSRRVGRTVRLEVIDERPLLDGRPVAGYIDAQVVRETLERADADASLGAVRAVIGEYVGAYRAATVRGVPGISALPGAHSGLDRLVAAGITLALVTGNAAGVAQRKLGSLGMAERFRFDPDAGFGDWRVDRSALVPAALAALDLGSGAVVALVGDTRADIAAARANGVIAVGVTTGAATEADLRDAGADLVLGSIEELAEALGLPAAVHA